MLEGIDTNRQTDRSAIPFSSSAPTSNVRLAFQADRVQASHKRESVFEQSLRVAAPPGTLACSLRAIVGTVAARSIFLSAHQTSR